MCSTSCYAEPHGFQSAVTSFAKYAKRALSSTMMTLLGRKQYARVGRFFWLQSRLDIENDMAANGEQLVHRWFAEHCAAQSRAPVVFDVGANLGAWSASLLAQLSAAGVDDSKAELHLFEPAPVPYEKLIERFANERATVHVRRLALADEPGSVRFHIFHDVAGINTLKPAAEETPSEVIEVEQGTVDTYCEEHGVERVDFVKVDTEGNDARVIDGALGMLQRGGIDLLQFEYNHRWITFRFYLKDVFDRVEPLGYRVGKITPMGIETYRRWHPELESFREGNYLLWRGQLPSSFKTLPWWNDG